MWNKNRFIHYFGVIGIFGSLVIFIYYTYVESWLLAYSFFALSGKYISATTEGAMKSFLSGFQGLEKNEFFDNGDKYLGELKDKRPHGRGIFTWAAGRKCEGRCQDGLYHGERGLIDPFIFPVDPNE